MNKLILTLLLALSFVLFSSDTAHAQTPKWVNVKLVGQKWTFGKNSVIFTGTYRVTNKSSLYVITGFTKCNIKYSNMRLLINGKSNQVVPFKQNTVTFTYNKYLKDYFEIFPGQSRTFTFSQQLAKYVKAANPSHNPYVNLKMIQGKNSAHKITFMPYFTPTVSYVRK